MARPKHPGCIICGDPHWGWGLCRAHHARFKRTGSTHRWTTLNSLKKRYIPGGDDESVRNYIRRYYPTVKL